MKLLVTGGLGFIGSNFIRHFLQIRPNTAVVNLDRLTYAGHPGNLADVSREAGGRYAFVRGDVADDGLVREILADGVTHVINFAAESHVDRSIACAAPFIQTNVLGTQVLLDQAREAGVEKFVQVSTDEVYGHLGPGDPPCSEDAPLAPRSPYAASKASADLLAGAAHVTHGFPVVVTRCTNNYGPRQFPEKLLPLFITNALAGKPLPVYGDGRNVREWLHVDDHAAALILALEGGEAGRVYNIGSGEEKSNLDLIQALLLELAAQTDKPVEEYQKLVTFVDDRAGHDRRYALDCGRLRRELDFSPVRTLADGLGETVAWYLSHRDWWESILDGTYQQGEGRGCA